MINQRVKMPNNEFREVRGFGSLQQNQKFFLKSKCGVSKAVRAPNNVMFIQKEAESMDKVMFLSRF